MTTTRRKKTRTGFDTMRTERVDDEQLVEVADLGPAPRTTFAIVDGGADHVALAKATLDALGHAVVASGTGAQGGKKVLAALRGDRPPEVVVVGIPGGEAIVDAARALEPRRPVIVAVLGGPAATAPDRAHAAGADLVTRRPHDAEHLGPTVLAAARLAAERARVVQLQGVEMMLRSRLAAHAESAETTGFHSFDVFKRVLEVELKRARRYGYALSVCQIGMAIASPAPAPAVATELRARTAAAIRGAIRDIDYPVEIGGERFLVLLPYTDVAGATLVARRILGAVRALEPVRGAGRTWSPAIAIGAAGLAAGGPVSMGALMKQAGDALREALRGKQELIVA